MDPVRGQVGDRPWGATVASLWRRGLTGRLTLALGTERFILAFERGALVGAVSPLVSESAPRIAIALGMATMQELGELLQLVANDTTRDDIDVVTAHLEVPEDRAIAFRRHVIARRAARTFAFEHGEYIVDETPIPSSGSAIDTRAAIYLGARTMMAEARLASELRRLGERFRLTEVATIPQYGMVDPPLARLTQGFTINELVTHEERAMAYALACAGACIVEPRRASTTSGRLGMPYSKRDSSPPETVPLSRATPPVGVPVQRASHPIQRTTPPSGYPIQRPATQPALPPSVQPSKRLTPTGGIPVVTPPKEHSTDRIPMRATANVTPPYGVPVRRPTPTPSVIRDAATAALLGQLKDRIASGFDTAALFGLPDDAPLELIRKAYLEIARLLRPSLGLGDDAQRVFAHVSGVFAALSDPSRTTSPHSVVEDTAKAAYCRGELALGTGRHEAAIEELTIANELEPNRAEYLALLAWAKFCASPDKQAVADQTRRALTEATTKTPNPVVPTFYLACVARALDRDREALRLFQRVLHLDPEHREARREVLALVQRLEKKGLLDRFRR